jgi:tetratricopeptide (TPR) repeat protein
MRRLLPLLLLTLCTLVAAQDTELEALRKDGHWKQIRTRVDAMGAAKANTPASLLWSSRVKGAFGDYAEALELARKAAELKPDDADIQSNLAVWAGELAMRTDGTLKQFSLAREMKKAGEAALALKPDHEEAVGRMMGYYMEAPGIVGGSMSKAQELALQAGKTDPVKGLYYQAQVALKRNDKPGAVALLDQALAKDPKSYETLLALARVPLMDKPQNLDKALATYRRALAVRPSGVSAHSQIASILAEQGKWTELDAQLADAKRQNPDNLAPWYAAASNLIAEKKFLDKAEGLLRAYLAQPAEGRAASHADAHWQLGKLKELLGKAREAMPEYELALKLKPGHKRAAEALAALKKA